MGSTATRVPGDKSISHRALILGALASGTSRVRGILTGDDVRSTARVLAGLGVAITTLDGDEVRVEGRGLRALAAPASPLDCGNSGTTARLMLGVLAAQPIDAILTGDASLRSRPMRRVTTPLAAMGASYEELGEGDRLPIRIRGAALRARDYASPRASAQVKSALLLAGACAGVEVGVREPVRSRDHTERMLAALGARIDRGPEWIRLLPPERLDPLDIDVPGDFSSAAFLLALALLRGVPLRVEAVGVNPTRTGLLGVLARMGARVATERPAAYAGEPVADLVVQPASLRATTVTGNDIPALVDEVPILAILAARAEGETRITGAAELRVKESDRLAVLAAGLRRVGVAAEELEDGLVVVGTDAPLRGRVETHADHRIAMAFGVLGASPGCEIAVDDPAAAAVSYPGFWDRLAVLGAAAGR